MTNSQRQIEEASPHIAEDDAELWHHFIRRDISNGEEKLKVNQPKNPCSWWKVYRKLKREDEAETKAAEERLKAALNQHKVGKDAKSTNIVRAVIPSGEKRSGWGSAPRALPMGSQALKNARSAQDKLKILNRQTAHRQQGRSAAQSIPAHQLHQLRGKITQAPSHMVRQYAAKAGPSRPPPPVPQTQAYRPVFAPKPQTYADRALTTALDNSKREQEARESRLRALTGASKPPSEKPAAPVTSSSAPSTQVRKRPAYDPFLPQKKRRP